MNTDDDDELGAALPDELALYLIQSSIDDGVYGPFANRDDAMAFAEQADGSVFECTARLIEVKEI